MFGRLVRRLHESPPGCRRCLWATAGRVQAIDGDEPTQVFFGERQLLARDELVGAVGIFDGARSPNEAIGPQGTQPPRVRGVGDCTFFFSRKTALVLAETLGVEDGAALAAV